MNGFSSLRVIINPWVNGSFRYCIVWSSYMSFAANTIVAKLTNQFQWNRLVTPSTDRHVSLNSLKSKSQMATRVLFGSTLTQTIALTDTPGFKPFTIMYYWGQTIKTGFHKQWSCSRNRSWSCVKRAYDLMKIGNWRCKWSHKLDGIRVERIRTFPFLPILIMTLLLMTQWKLDCWSWKQKQKNKPITRPGIKRCDWFILLILPVLNLPVPIYTPGWRGELWVRVKSPAQEHNTMSPARTQTQTIWSGVECTLNHEVTTPFYLKLVVSNHDHDFSELDILWCTMVI